MKLHACTAGKCGGEKEGGETGITRGRGEGGEGRAGRKLCGEGEGEGGETEEREVKISGCQVANANCAALKGWVPL